MPTGTGKTVSVLSGTISYMLQYPDKYTKLIYCTRTVVEMEKTLKELQFIMNKIDEEIGKKQKILGVGLSARRNLCINSNANSSRDRDKVDAECRKLTAEWVRDSHKGKESEKDMLCSYYEVILAYKFRDFMINMVQSKWILEYIQWKI